MKYILPLITVGSLFVAGCHVDNPATDRQNDNQSRQATATEPKKLNIRPETEQYLFNSNQVVCIEGALYFASWEEGGVVIRSPVMDTGMPNGVMECTGGYRINQFGKLY